jgi:hypothetical protein
MRGDSGIIANVTPAPEEAAMIERELFPALSAACLFARERDREAEARADAHGRRAVVRRRALTKDPAIG